MNNIKLISDSSCDFTKLEIEKYNIDIVPFSVSFDGVTYLKESVDITYEEFYEKLNDPNVFAKTSLPSVSDYIEKFEKAIKDGKDILCFTISAKFSGSYQSAINAKQIILEDYPEAKIEVIDTKLATLAQGVIVKLADELIKSGKSIEETAEIVLKNRDNVRVYLTVNTLKYLQKGGRIGKVQSIAGELLNVNPIITLADGELVSVTKIRGRKKVVNFIVENSKKFLEERNINISNKTAIIFTCNQDTTDLEEKCLEEGFKNIEKINVGVTVAAHTGNTITGVCVCDFVY